MWRWVDVDDPEAVVDAGAATIGAAVRAARLRRRLSQQQLAWRVGLSQPTISRLETGRLQGMRLRRLALILGFLQVGVPALVPGGPPSPRRRLPGQPPPSSFESLIDPDSYEFGRHGEDTLLAGG